MRAVKYLLMLMGGWLMMTCVQPFAIPQLASNQTNILVVNAFLNVQSDTIVVKLSRTRPIGSTPGSSGEANAIVTLEDSYGAIFNLSPRGSKGEYFRQGLPLTAGATYRLRVKTSDLKEYLSNPVVPSAAPPIDAVTWQKTDSGIDIYLDSHDPSNSTRYYRWDYKETYEYTSTFNSQFIIHPTNGVVYRDNSNQIYRCWKTDLSTTINVGSTIQLTEDVAHVILLHIPTTSQKIMIKYSVLARQYGITRSEYEYWDNARKLSETQGTLFDAQPSDVAGNMVCVSHPLQNVLGYFSAGSVTEKRIFIESYELPQINEWRKITSYDDCLAYANSLGWVKNDVNILKFTGLIINVACPPEQSTCDLNSGGPAGTGPPGYSTGPSSCIDCTQRLQGKTTKPSFWQ